MDDRTRRYDNIVRPPDGSVPAAPPVARNPPPSPAPRPNPPPAPRPNPPPVAAPNRPPLAVPLPSHREPVPRVPTPPRRRRRKWGRWVLGPMLVILPLLALWGAFSYSQIERVPTGNELSPDGGPFTNYLIVGTDSREGITVDNPLAGAILGDGEIQGERTDTLVVLRVEGSSAKMMALPRDLFLPISGTDRQGRINAVYQDGPDQLIRTVQNSLGVPIHHYAEVDLAGLLDLVVATGGVTIEFDAPAFDRKSGLQVDQSGPVRLDPDQALAFVRSRTYTRVIDGVERVDGRGDIGRVERQQQFLKAVVRDVAATRNPVKLERISRAMTSSVKADDQLSLVDSLSLARRLSGFQPETVVLPTVPHTTSGGASVLLLNEPTAQTALDQFR